MSLYNFCLIAGPAILLIGGSLLLVAGRLVPFRWLYFGFVFTILTLALITQIIVGLGLNTALTKNYAVVSLFNYAFIDSFQVQMSFRADWFSYIFALSLVALTLLISVYLALRQPDIEDNRNIKVGRLFGLIMLAAGTALAAFYTADLIMLVFWLETFGLITYLLIGPGLRGATSSNAAYQAFGVTWLGGLLIFVTFLIIISRNGGNALYPNLAPATLDNLLFGLVVIGAILKAAQFPVSSWLGDLNQLPAAVYGLLCAGAIFPLAIYVPLRLQLIAAPSGQDFLASDGWLLLLAGALALLTCGWLGIRELEYTKKSVYLVLTQMSFAIIAVGLDDFRMAGLQIISLLLFAPALFICADLMAIESAPPPPNPSGKGAPVPVNRPPYYRYILTTLYAISAVGAVGLPIALSYPVHWQILSDLLTQGSRLSYFSFACVIIGIILSLAIAAQILASFLNAEIRTVEAANNRSYWTLIVPGLFALASLIAGFNPAILDNWLNKFTTGLAAPDQITVPRSLLEPSGWFGLLALLAGLIAVGLYVGKRKFLAAPVFNGGLLSEEEITELNKQWRKIRGREQLSLTVAEEALPSGFEDEFFRSGFRGQAVAQAQAQAKIEPRLATTDFFGPLNSRLRPIYQIFDTSFGGGLFGRIGLIVLGRLRTAFEWATARFYAALAAFLLIILIILLTR